MEQSSAVASHSSSTRVIKRKKSLSSEQMSMARLTQVNNELVKRRNDPVNKASFGESTMNYPPG